MELFEVNLVVDGVQQMTVNGVVYHQHPGDLLLLKPGDVHAAHSETSPMTYYCLHFDLDDPLLRELLYRNRSVFYRYDNSLTTRLRPRLEKLIAITSSNNRKSVSQRMMALSVVFELFAEIIQCMEVEQSAGIRRGGTLLVSREIADALEGYVEMGSLSNSTEQAKDVIRQISMRLGYSPSSCNRAFHQVYGLSPRQYLSTLKLKKAKILLMESKLSVEDISARLGYADIAHFSRQFKRWTGESPREFRSRFQ